MSVAEDGSAPDPGVDGSDGRSDLEGAHPGRECLVTGKDVMQILEALRCPGVVTLSTDFGDYNVGKEVPRCFRMKKAAYQSTTSKDRRIQLARPKFLQDTFK